MAATNVVLVHGAFCDGSSWNKVIPLLHVAGYGVIAVQLPLDSLSGDIAVTKQALASLEGPTVLVGHSYGGAVISGAAVDAAHVVSLVYVAAYALDAGESLQTINDKFPGTEGQKHIGLSYLENAVWIDPAVFPQVFAADVDPSEAKVMASVQKPTGFGCLGEPLSQSAWHSLPSWYLVSENDMTVNPDAERWMAERMGATVQALAANHASPVSHPQPVADAIFAAAQAEPKA